MAKKKRRRWIIYLLLALIILAIVFYYLRENNKPKGEAVTTEKVERRTIKETVSASGRIFPEKEVKISSDVSGEIIELLVEEGDSVKVGQIVARIDQDTYVSNVERGQAGLNAAKSQIAVAEAQIESSKAQKAQITAQLDNAQKVHDRNIKLYNDGVISQIEFDQSLSTLEGLQANLSAAVASLKSAQENVNSSKYNAQSSEASLKEMRTSLNRTTIKSPTNGTISSLSVEKGERVVGTMQMAGTEMMRIANLNTMEVQVEVSENDILKVQLGDIANIEVDAYLDRKFKGVVTEIANSASNISSTSGSLNTDQVTNFVVKILMDPDSYNDLISTSRRYPFRPGMSASVDIFTDVVEDVVSIPIQAVTVRDMNAKKEKGNSEASATDNAVETSSKEDIKEVVFLYEADTARMVRVATGIQDDEFIQITSGLDAETEIIVGPYSIVSKKLDEGTQLRKKDEETEKEDKS